MNVRMLQNLRRIAQVTFTRCDLSFEPALPLVLVGAVVAEDPVPPIPGVGGRFVDGKAPEFVR